MKKKPTKDAKKIKVARNPAMAAALGGRVKAARDARGWTNYDLSVAAGLKPETLSRMQHGVLEPGASSVAKLAVALGVTSDHLLGIEKVKPRRKAA